MVNIDFQELLGSSARLAAPYHFAGRLSPQLIEFGSAPVLTNGRAPHPASATTARVRRSGIAQWRGVRFGSGPLSSPSTAQSCCDDVPMLQGSRTFGMVRHDSGSVAS